MSEINWENFISERIPEILKENEFRYGKFAVSYSSKVSDFLKTYLVSRGKKSLDKVLKVDVKVRNLQPTAKELSEIIFENVPVARMPLVTDSGIVIKGTKYFYVNEIKQADGWYVLSSTTKAEDGLEAVDSNSDDFDRQLSIPSFDSDFEENSDEFTSDEMDGSEDITNKLENEISKIKDSSDLDDVAKSEFEETNLFDNNEEDSVEIVNEDDNKYSTYLEYRGPFGRNLRFSINKNKDGTRSFKVQFISNKRKKTVSWFTFLKAILPNLSAEEIAAKFYGLPIINEAYVSALHSYALKAKNDVKEPSIESSSEECAMYVLSEFFITKNGNKFLTGVDNPVGELNSRLNSIRCKTEQRNKDIYSFCNLTGYTLRESLGQSSLSKDELSVVSSKIKIPEEGDSLSLEQLIILDAIEGLDHLVVSKEPNSKPFTVEKPPVRDDFVDEIVDMIKHYLLVCEGIGSPFKMDDFKNKEIDTIESKFENMITKTLFEFNNSFCDVISTRSSTNSELSENELSKCFVKDINRGYKDLLKSIHESSNYQGKDDTNSLAEYSQSKQLKYGVKNAPMSLRSLAEDQYGFICPQTTSEGGNVGLNIFRTTSTIIEDNVVKKKFYALNNGKIVKEDGKDKIVALSAGEVSRTFVIKYTPELASDINSEVVCYCGTHKTKARLRNIGYMELSDGQNVSPNLANIVGANNNGGKRGTMGPNQEKQSQPLLIPQRAMVDTGVFEHENIGVIRAEKFIKKALTEIGKIEYLSKIDDAWSISLEKSTQKDYASKLQYSVAPPTELCVKDSELNTMMTKVFNYDIPTLSPTVKRSMRHFIPVVKDSNSYLSSEIVVRASDVDVSEHNANGEGYLGVEESNFGPAGGTQLRVAFGIYEGFGYEDAIIINEDSVYSGKIATMSFFNVVDEIKITGKEDDSSFGCIEQLPHLTNEGIPRKGVTLGVGDIVIAKINKVKSGKDILKVPSYTRLKEGSKDKGCVVASSIEEYRKEDGFKYLRATVSLMYVSNPSFGTKFSGGHGNKGVAAKIVPACMMPYDEEGNRADLVLNATGSLPRNNLGQFTEIIKNTIGIKTNTVQLIKPFEKWDILGILKDARMHGVVPKKMYDGVTGQPFDREVLIGYMTIFRSEHDVKGKFNSCSLNGNVNSNTLTVSRGPGGGQRIGEMTTWALIAKGATKYLDSMFTVQGGDVLKKEAFQKALKNNLPTNSIDMQGDNRLNILAKVRYLLMGCIFEDFNSGMFRPLNNDIIEMEDSPFIISQNYSIGDGEDSKTDDRFGKESNQASSRALVDFQSFKYARCVNMHKRFIYPIYVESSFLQNNLWYMTSSLREDNALYSSLSSLISNDWEKPSFVSIENIKHMSDVTVKELLDKKKFVVWIKGMRLPFIVNKKTYNENLSFLKEVPNYSQAKFEECVKIVKGYDAIISILLGFNFSPNDDVNNSKCSKNGSLIESLVLYKLIRATEGSNANKFGVTSYNFGDFFKDTIKFSSNLGSEVNITFLDGLFKRIQEKSDAIEKKKLEELQKPKDEREEIESMNGILRDFVCNNENEDFPEFDCLEAICEARRYDLFKEISCSYFWVPPKVYRGDNIGGGPSPLKRRITGLVKLFKEFQSNVANSEYTTNVYKNLSSLSLYCINELKNHNNKNAILRDQVMSVRVNCSARGYITVDPTLGMDEVGLSIYHAAGIFETFLYELDGYNADSTLYHILEYLDGSPDDSKDELMRYRKVKSNLFKFLSSDNKHSFNQDLKDYEVYKQAVRKLVNEGVSDREARNKVFEDCKMELVRRLKDLLEIHPISLERAPTFWENSVQAFHGKLRFNCHSIALCPLVCKAFNADFDGDQMSQTAAIDKGAIEEQKEIMFPSSNIINVSDGKLIMNLNQDMALGIYWLTIEKQNKLSASRVDTIDNPEEYVVREEQVPVNSYCDINILSNDIDMGFVTPHDYIIFRKKVDGKERFYKDTAGRILFNGLIPEAEEEGQKSGFTSLRRAVIDGNVVLVNDVDGNQGEVEFLDEFYALYTDTVNLKCIRNKDLQKIANDIAHSRSTEVVKDYLEGIMRLGFAMAHKSGVSLSLYDFEEIISNQEIKGKVDDLKKEVEEAKEMLEMGFSTEDEYKKYLTSRFIKANDYFSDYLQDNLSRYSNLYLLIDSGARGSFKQLVAQSIMVGLPNDSKGNPIPEPIFGNYVEGLDSTEYFNTSYTAREALVTGSMYTGNIGEILRTMVYQCEHNVIQYECGEYGDEDFCDAESVPIPLEYKVTLPGNFDIDIAEFIPIPNNSQWDSVIEDWEKLKLRTPYSDNIDVFKKLLCKYSVTHFRYRIKGSDEVIDVNPKYKITDYYRNMLMERSIDMDKWKYPEDTFDAGLYNVVDNSTLKVLEETAKPSINIYLAMNCKHKNGICRRCFGVTDLWKVPKKFSNVGIKSAQSIGQVSSQLALDSHKSSGGSALSNFSSFVNILRQHELGNQVFVAKESGILDIEYDSGETQASIRVISPNSVQELGTYKVKSDMSFMKYKKGDYIKAGDVLYYNKTLNYSMMLDSMRSADLNDLKKLDKCKLNLLREIVELYDCDLSIRHFDILLRDLTKFGVSTETRVVGDQLFVEGGVYPTSVMDDYHVDYDAVVVSSLKSMQFNNKHASSMAMSYLRKQIGNASILKKESATSPLNCLLEGICLEDVYGDNPLTQDEIYEKYAPRQYGENINCNLDEIQSRYKTLRLKESSKQYSLGELKSVNKERKKTRKNRFLNFDEPSEEIKKNTIEEEKTTEEVSDVSREDKKDKVRVRDRIKLHNRPDGVPVEKQDDNAELDVRKSKKNTLDADKTSLFQ